jgi:hypothetical protein
MIWIMISIASNGTSLSKTHPGRNREATTNFLWSATLFDAEISTASSNWSTAGDSIAASTAQNAIDSIGVVTPTTSTLRNIVAAARDRVVLGIILDSTWRCD